MAAMPFVKVLRAGFHGGLMGPWLGFAAWHSSCAPSVHAQRNGVGFRASLHVGCLMRLRKFALEGGNFFGVIELDHMDGFLGVSRMQRGHDQRLGVPLDHQIWVANQLDG